MPKLILLFLGLLLVACQQAPTPTAVPIAVATAEPTPIPPTATPTMEPTATATATATATPLPTATATPTVTPSPTPIPPKELTVCMASLPSEVAFYGEQSLPATAVRHALYESPWVVQDFVYQPQGLAGLPTAENGGLRWERVQVSAGRMVANSQGRIIPLRLGDTVLNSNGEPQTFEGNPIFMNQMVVEFTFQPLVWSDGTAVTAEDSVFSYELARDPFTLSDKRLIEHTASYEAVDELTVRWTSIPGLRVPRYLDYVWSPLPRHQWEGIAPIRLAELDEVMRTPLATGPFVVAQWGDGVLELEPNPHYYRSAEGLPYLDRLRFTAVPAPANPLDLLTSGACDVVTQDLILLNRVSPQEAAEQGATLYVSDGVVWEHIAFGINSYGRTARTRPDWFQETAVRQAMLHCTNREAMVEQFTGGLALLTDSYLPATHPLNAGLPAAPAYDPSAGNALLDALGYVDADGDGWRNDISTSTPFSFTIRTTPGELRLAIAQQFAEDMAVCGLQVQVVEEATSKFFADNIEGTIFPRNFDVALFGWLVGVDPTCEHYQSQEISGPVEERFAGWRGANITGFFSRALDNACQVARVAPYGTEEYVAAHTQALGVFTAEWPSIPLFARPKLMLATTAVQHLAPTASQPSELWNVAEWDVVR